MGSSKMAARPGKIPISNNPEQSQTVQTQQFLRNVVCSIFHVPPHMAGEIERGKATVEQMGQELKEYTFSPWTTALKIEYKRKLFPNSGIGRKPKNAYFVDFDMHEMTRPDAASLEKFYASGKQWGYLNTNDIRSREGINPIDEDWAEDYWMPINMTPLDPNHQDGNGDGNKPEPLNRAYSRLFRDAFGRVLIRENRDFRAFQQAFGPVLFPIRDVLTAETNRELRCESQPGSETDKFIGEYLSGLQKRSAEWTAESADETARQELERAIRALRVAVYREAAAAKAKQGEEQHAA